MQRIKLLYVITELELGGAQKQLLSLISHLDEERFEPFLFTAGKGLLLPEALSIKRLTVKRSLFLERNINPLKDIFALAEIYFFIKKNNIEIVHTHSSKAGILGRIAAGCAKVRVIVHTVHGWPFNDYQPVLFRKIFMGLEKLTAQFTDRIIVVSNHDKEKGIANRIGRENKYSLIRYGINHEEFAKTEKNVKEELGINAKDLVVTDVSCLKPQKSPLDFIKLAYLLNRFLPNIKFLLVGDGILRKKIENLILRLDLQNKVILTGWRKDIPRILSVTDILVLTSLWEGLPISVLEAMAASRPVVATHTGGVKEVMIEGETGFLIAPQDINTMSETVARLLRNENLRKAVGQRARDSLGLNFRLGEMVNKTQDLYDNLMEKKRIKFAQ